MPSTTPPYLEELTEYCRSQGIMWVATYDAAIVRRNYPGADRFLLVEFEQGRKVGREFFKIEQELTDIIGGACGDLKALSELADYYRDEILAAATIEFASDTATHLPQMLAKARESWAEIKAAEKQSVKEKVKAISPEKLAEFCRSRGIKWLAASNADISWRDHPGVDLLLLAEFEEERKVSYFKLFDMERELTKLYDVTKASLITPSGLRERKEELLASATVQFDA